MSGANRLIDSVEAGKAEGTAGEALVIGGEPGLEPGIKSGDQSVSYTSSS